VRETREETGWNVRVTDLVGAYQWKAETGRHYLRFAFAAEPIDQVPDARLDEGIVQALWLAPSELQALASRHRSPLVWRCVADYLGGSRHPLDLVRQLA
jgi:8-oxo-dGTP pyrophosphatase MutT (NUDIX family)